jgi:ribosomal protein S4E
VSESTYDAGVIAAIGQTIRDQQAAIQHVGASVRITAGEHAGHVGRVVWVNWRNDGWVSLVVPDVVGHIVRHVSELEPTTSTTGRP